MLGIVIAVWCVNGGICFTCVHTDLIAGSALCVSAPPSPPLVQTQACKHTHMQTHSQFTIHTLKTLRHAHRVVGAPGLSVHVLRPLPSWRGRPALWIIRVGHASDRRRTRGRGWSLRATADSACGVVGGCGGLGRDTIWLAL